MRIGRLGYQRSLHAYQLAAPGRTLDQQIAVRIENQRDLKESLTRILRGINQRSQAGDSRLVWTLHDCLQAITRGHRGELKSAILADSRNPHRQHGWIVIVDESTKARELVRGEAVKIHSGFRRGASA